MRLFRNFFKQCAIHFSNFEQLHFELHVMEFYQFSGEHESSSSPKWTHLNSLHSGHGGNASSGNGGAAGNGINNNTNVHSSFKTSSTDNAPAPVGTYASHLPPHHPSTISSQFSALLGASSAGYLLSSSEASKTTMPIF